LALGLGLGLGLGACGADGGGRAAEDSGGGPGGKADDNDDVDDTDGGVGGEHIEAVASCEGVADRGREHTADARTSILGRIEQERLECLTEANDAVVGTIDGVLQDAGSDRSGRTGEAFQQWRSIHVTTCELLVRGSDVALDKAATVRVVACNAASELGLANLVDAFANLGAAPVELMPNFEAHAACFGAFDASRAAAPGTEPEAEETKALLTLADCIRDDIVLLGDDVVDRVLEAYPGRDPEATQEEFVRVLDGQTLAIGEACATLGHASRDAGQPRAEVQEAKCGVLAVSMTFDLIGEVIPALESDTGASGVSDGGDESGTGAATGEGDTGATTTAGG
jgi:hypothetical protein